MLCDKFVSFAPLPATQSPVTVSPRIWVSLLKAPPVALGGPSTGPCADPALPGCE